MGVSWFLVVFLYICNVINLFPMIDFSGLPFYRFFVDTFDKVRSFLLFKYEKFKIKKECSNELRIQTYAYCKIMLIS